MPRPKEDPTELTQREQDAVRLVASGMRRKDAAQEMGIEIGTLGAYLKRAYGKLGANSAESAAKRLRQRYGG